jgi:hypothetical protein
MPSRMSAQLHHVEFYTRTSGKVANFDLAIDALASHRQCLQTVVLALGPDDPSEIWLAHVSEIHSIDQFSRWPENTYITHEYWGSSSFDISMFPNMECIGINLIQFASSYAQWSSTKRKCRALCPILNLLAALKLRTIRRVLATRVCQHSFTQGLIVEVAKQAR